MRLLLTIASLAALLGACSGGQTSRVEDEPDATRAPVQRAVPGEALVESLASGNLTVGSELYALKCQGCHGTRQQPGALGPSLFALDWQDERRVEAVRQTIGEGLGEMPAFGNRMPGQQITDIMAWLASR